MDLYSFNWSINRIMQLHKSNYRDPWIELWRSIIGKMDLNKLNYGDPELNYGDL